MRIAFTRTRVPGASSSRARRSRRREPGPAAMALGALALALAMAGCGEAVSTSSFKGEEHSVAQRISSFQKHATEGGQGKICENDLATNLQARIKASGRGCAEAIKEQLKNVEDLTLTVQSVTVHGRTATATVKSTRSGKSQLSTLKLQKEGEDWKISGVS
jgi:copper chaperone CopZ